MKRERKFVGSGKRCTGSTKSCRQTTAFLAWRACFFLRHLHVTVNPKRICEQGGIRRHHADSVRGQRLGTVSQQCERVRASFANEGEGASGILPGCDQGKRERRNQKRKKKKKKEGL